MRSTRLTQSIVSKPGNLRRRLVALAVGAAFGASVHANPSGQSVASGNASFAASGNSLTITNTPGAIINWQQFSIGKDEITRFIQQNAASAVLNRVVGQDPSAILGQLFSNGRVFLINPAGIAIGRGAVIDVAGFAASTLNIGDADFLSGRMRFAGTGSEGKLTNAGTINTLGGGQVYLIAPNVENQASGVINTPGGQVMISAGKSVQLVNPQTPDIRVEFTAPQNEAANAGQVVAAGGRVGIYGTLIRNSGLVSASGAATGGGGRIFFKAVRDITLDAASRVEANGTKGGSVTVQAETGTLLASGVIEAKGNEDKGGEVWLLGARVGLVSNARVDASGERGGGMVLVGGDFQGKNPDVQNAKKNYIARDVTIRADALADGDGGKVVVWADDWTKYYGSISARGGAAGGHGGSVEVSGKRELDFNGVVDVLAAHGKAGSVLLDPGSITIVSGAPGDGGDDGAVAGGTVTFTDGATAPFTISAGALEALSGNITLQSQAQTDVNASLNLTNQTAGTTVTFQAGGNMNVNQPITTAGGKLILVAGDSAYNAGSPSPALIIASGANLTTNGGDISLLNQKGTGGTGIGIGADVNAGAGTVRITDSSNGISQQAGTAITAAALGISSVGPVMLDQTNNIGTLAANLTGAGSAFSFKNANGLTVGSVSAGYSSPAVDGLSVASGGGGISLSVTGAGSDITLNGAVNGNAGTVTLNAAGLISQTATGTINTSGTLTGGAGTTVTLDQGNTIGSLGAFSANGNLNLNDTTGGLTLSGALGAGTGTMTVATAGGALALGANNVTGVGVSLTGRGVTQSSGSTVAAGAGNVTVVGSDGTKGAINLDGAITGANVTVRNASTVGLGNVTTAGTLTLGVGADLSGAVTQNATRVLGAGTLAGSTASSVNLGNANTIGSLGAFTTNGAFTLNDAGGGLSVSGAVNSGSGATTITTTGGMLSLAGSGSVTGTGVSLVNNDGGIALGGGVTASGGSALSLTATAGIDQTAGTLGAGAGTLDGGNGAIVLVRPANDFTGTVTLKNAGASNDVTIVDANALTIGASAIGRNLDVTAPTGITLAGTIGSGGTQSYHNTVIIGLPSTLSSTGIGAAGNMNFASAVEGGSGGLTVNTAGTTIFTGSVGSVTPVASLQIGAGGSTTIGAGGLVKTSGAQTYGSPVTITTNTQLLTTGGGDIALDGGLTGTNLTLALGGSGTPAGNVSGTSLALGTTSGALNLQKIATSASFTGTVTAGTLSVPASVNNVSLTGNATQVTNPVDFENTGNTTLGAAGGSQTYTGGFTTSPGGVTFLNGTLSTGGTAAQSLSFNDAVQLSTATTLNAVAAPVTFASTLDGPGGLIVNTSGTTQFSGNIGNSSRLGSLETKGSGLTNLASGLAVRTTGRQSFDDRVTAADLTIDSSGTGTAGAITAANPLNDFTGTLAVIGGATQIVDRNSLTLGAVNITGTASFTANDGSITTGGAGNPFRASGDITLIAKDGGAAQSAAGSITIDAGGLASTGGGKVNLYAADNVSVVDPGASGVPGDVNGVQSNGGQITILAGQTPGMLANPGTETVADGFGKVLINAPLNAGATGNLRIVTAGTGLASADSDVTQGASGAITANALTVVTLKGSGVSSGGGADILLNGATVSMNQVSTISMLSCPAIGCPALPAEPVAAGVPPLGSLIQSPAATLYANGLLRYTGVSPAGVPVDISGIGTTNDFFAFVTGPFNLTAFPFSANNVTLEAVGPAGTITLNLAKPLTKINDSGSGTLSFVAGGDINLLNTATSSIGNVNADGSVSLFNHNLVMTAAGNINIDNSIVQGARNLTIAADAAFKTANQNTFACPTPATCSLLAGNGTGMDGIGNVTMMGNHVVSTRGDVTVTGRDVSLWGKGGINALGVADPTIAPAGTNPSGQELTVAGTIDLRNTGVISVQAGISSASSRSGARLTAGTVNIGANGSPNNPTRLDIVGGDNSLGFATDNAIDPLIELRQADAKIESLRNMFVYLRKDPSMPDAFGNPTSLRILGGTATANNSGAPMLYVTALGALRAERIEIVADGSLLIQGGTSVLQSSNAFSVTSAVLLAKDYKKITTNGLGSVVIKGGTAIVTPGLSAHDALAQGQLDPSTLILDIAGNLVLQGGTSIDPQGNSSPQAALTSARIDAGGEIKINVSGPAIDYSFTTSGGGTNKLTGQAFMIGGTGSGIFDKSFVSLTGQVYPITINVPVVRFLDAGLGDAVIQTGRNVFDQSLLNYLIFAANEAGATRRIRLGSKEDDDGGAAACQ